MAELLSAKICFRLNQRINYTCRLSVLTLFQKTYTTTTIQYERYNTDGAKICSRKQRTKYDRRYDEEANRARRRGSVSGKPERHTRENFHTHYDSSPLTFGRHEEPMRNLFCTRNKKIETRRKISQSATICRIFLGGKLARSRSSSSSTQVTGAASCFDD